MGILFIHAQWRTGSTYIWNAIRRTNNAVAYCEPVHESVLAALQDPRILLSGEETVRVLRHPDLTAPYFFELSQNIDLWRGHIQKKMLYDTFFLDPDPDLSDFFSSFIYQDPKPVVVQECRSYFRINGLARSLGGDHLYLWRDPRNQFVSYSVSPYFRVATLLILNAISPPTFVGAIKNEFGIPTVRDTDIGVEYKVLESLQLDSAKRYKIFFSLWTAALTYSLQYANDCVSIDRLAVDESYRSELTAYLHERGIGNVSFQDCRIPQYQFADEQLDMFSAVEQEVFHLLEDSGYTTKQKLYDVKELINGLNRSRG